MDTITHVTQSRHGKCIKHVSIDVGFKIAFIILAINDGRIWRQQSVVKTNKGETLSSIPQLRNVSIAGIYLACIMLAYTQSAGITTIYLMASTLYRIFDDPLRIGWVVTSYYLVAASSSALCGRFGDLLGRRRICIVVLTIAGVGAVISASATGLEGVIIGCTLQGAAGGLVSLGIGILRENLPPTRLSFAIGVISSAAIAGAGISWLIAGLVIDHYSWNGGFWMKAILAAITIVALLAYVPAGKSTPGGMKNIKVMPGLLFVPAVAGVFVAIQFSHEWGWGDLRILGLVIGSVLLIAFWVWHQRRQEKPLIYVRSLANRQVLFGNLILGAMAAGWCQNGQILSLILQQPTWTGTGFAVSASFSGMVLLGLNLISLVASPWGGAMAARHGARRAALIASVIGTLAWTAIVINHASMWFFIAALALVMVGICVLHVTGFNLVIEATEAERTSEASGMSFVIFYTASAIGGQAIFLLLATATVSQTGGGSFPAASAYDLALGFVEAMSLIGLVIAFLLPKNKETFG